MVIVTPFFPYYECQLGYQNNWAGWIYSIQPLYGTWTVKDFKQKSCYFMFELLPALLDFDGHLRDEKNWGCGIQHTYNTVIWQKKWNISKWKRCFLMVIFKLCLLDYKIELEYEKYWGGEIEHIEELFIIGIVKNHIKNMLLFYVRASSRVKLEL